MVGVLHDALVLVGVEVGVDATLMAVAVGSRAGYTVTPDVNEIVHAVVERLPTHPGIGFGHFHLPLCGGASWWVHSQGHNRRWPASPAVSFTGDLSIECL